MSPGREITDRGLIEALRFALLTLALAVVPCPRAALSPFTRCGPPEGNRRPVGSGRRALMESVDNWPMATLILKTIGGKPKPVAVSGRDRWKVSSS